MFFQKKIDRAMKWLKDKNGGEGQETDSSQEQAADSSKKQEKSKSKLPDTADKKESILEKHDFLAMILAALLVFGPILIILAIILILVTI